MGKQQIEKQGSQVVGVRMTPETAKRFKTEAAKRGISGRRLFEEMWADYQAARGKAKK